MIFVVSLFACDKADCCNKSDEKCKHATEQGCDKPCDKHKDCPKGEKCKDKANCQHKDCPKSDKCKNHGKHQDVTEVDSEKPSKGCNKGGMDKCKMKGKKCGSMGKMTNSGEEKIIYYTCPMDSHKHIRSREAGKCSECGMDMVAGVITTEDKADFYGCPMLMHSHIRSDKPGLCDRAGGCGMNLEPMRLVK